jgi:peroxiredoxin
MRKLLQLSAIVLPAIVVIVGGILVSQRILGHRRASPAVSDGRVVGGSLLPRGRLVNLETNHDAYQRVVVGKVLLVFVTTDCDACRKELSNLTQVAPSLASRVTVYGVGIEDRDSVKTFIDANPVCFPVLLDHGAAILSSLGFRLMPTKVLLQDGVIKKIWYGSSPNTNALIKDVGEVE